MLKFITLYPEIIKTSADNLNPALNANYTYELVKTLILIINLIQLLKVESKLVRIFRLSLSYKIGLIIKSSMYMLGIDVPNKM